MTSNNNFNDILFNFTIEYKYIISLIISIILGFAIGFERKSRSKEAGVRTHTIVCFGACLMMLISKYGFSGADADASRIASQIVSGIGFIGAGMIVYRKNAVHGLTTAAGVWSTAGIGMACGCGLYIVAIAGTILMICAQCIFHINCKLFNAKKSYQVKVSFVQTENENQKIKEIFSVKHFQKVKVVRGEKVVWDITLSTANEIESSVIDKIIKENSFILDIERVDE